MKKTILALWITFSVFTINAQSYTFNDIGGEYHFVKEGHHFMSLVYVDILNQNAFAWRPHPGKDPNGWGSTLYLTPFFPGGALNQVDIVPPTILPNDQGFEVKAQGSVMLQNGASYGNWEVTFQFQYDSEMKKITGGGTYHIHLDGLMSSATGDLNLYRLASNYLIEVPLLCNPNFGNTGDMDTVFVDGGPNFQKIWLPPFDSFPNDNLDLLTVDVTENYNSVDTKAQGHESIMPAHKPSMKIKLKAWESDYRMRFGAIFDETMSKAFYSDNVGITPLINKNSPFTDFSFDFDFESMVSVEQVETPQFSECVDNMPVELEIFSETPNSTIIYNFNETMPNVDAFEYVAPVLIEEDVTVFAQAYKCGLETSELDSMDCLVSTINRWVKNLNLQVYPKPAQTNLTLDFFLQERQTINLSVFSLSGQLIYFEKIQHSGGNLNHQILIDDWKEGLYYLFLNGKYADTFIKIN